MNSLRQTYQEKIVPVLKKELNLDNTLSVPKVVKVTVNTSSSEFKNDANLVEKTKGWMSDITGQAPKVTKARTSIAAFNLRAGDIVGMSVTLRGERMYDFVQKLISIVLPRTKDFQGIKTTSFDKNGNYTLGLSEQLLFPEVEYDKIGKVQGLEITFTTSASDPQSAKALLTALGMPFAKEE